MHTVLADRITYDTEIDDNLAYEIPLFFRERKHNRVSDIAFFWQERISQGSFQSFDQWEKLLNRDIEYAHFQEVIRESLVHPPSQDTTGLPVKLHICGISCFEEVEILRQMYYDQMYFEEYPRRCRVPYTSATVTASTPIRNVIYSRKDKNTLPSGSVYFPPIRSPSDQRMILTGLRTGIILGIDVEPGEEHLIGYLLNKEIFSPYELGRLLCYNFLERGVPGVSHKQVFSLEIIAQI